MPSRPPLPVIVNVAGGAASRAGAGLRKQIEAAFAAARQPIALELVDGKKLPAALERHANAPRVVVGGGDGTLATAAGAISGANGELAVLPLGTRNHFAVQVGVPSDLAAAAELAAKGRSRLVDLGQAGDRVFINNLSAGAYVELVREREASGLPKLIATIPAAWGTLRKLRSRRFELTIDGERVPVRTPLLFVGNNRYEVEEGRLGDRAALDDGMLSIYAVAPLSRASLFAAALRTLVARPRMHRDFTLDRTAREVRIEGPGATIEVALDGERARFDLPLTIRLAPRSLAVVSPPESG
jgi:diacylglycerol kinase family enzyme